MFAMNLTIKQPILRHLWISQPSEAPNQQGWKWSIPFASSPCIFIKSTLKKRKTMFLLKKSQVITILPWMLWFHQGEITTRIGGILAPFSGTLPPSVSCKFFALLCLLAGLCSMHLPDSPYTSRKEQKILCVDSPRIHMKQFLGISVKDP